MFDTLCMILLGISINEWMCFPGKYLPSLPPSNRDEGENAKSSRDGYEEVIICSATTHHNKLKVPILLVRRLSDHRLSS